MGKIGDALMQTEEYIKKNPKHYEKLKRYLDEDDDIRVILKIKGTKQQKIDYHLNQARYMEAAQIIEMDIIWPYIESLNNQIKNKDAKSLLSSEFWCMAGVATYLTGTATDNLPLQIASFVCNSVTILKFAKNKLFPAGERLIKRAEKILQEWTICKHLPHFIQDFAVLNDINLFDSPFEGDNQICVSYVGWLTDIILPSEENVVEIEQGE